MEYRRASSLVALSEMRLTSLGHRFIARICACSALDEISDEEAIAQIKIIRVSFGRSVNDDDVFLYTKSPFDNQWYYFAAGITGSFSEEPYITGADLEDPNNGFIEPLDEISSEVHTEKPRPSRR
jgi:hypothetical protein